MAQSRQKFLNSSFIAALTAKQDLVGCGSSLPWGSLSTFSEVALEPPRHMSHVPHPSGSCGLAPNGLHAPVVLADAGGGVTAGGAGALLEVEAAAAAADAERVRLVPALAEAARTLTHCLICSSRLGLENGAAAAAAVEACAVA